jgi:DNA-binding NarL/FixJ family response regulator
VTAPAARRRLALADDGIIDPVAVDLAARGTRPIALTRTERQLAAAAILARGGSTYHIAVRLHVSGTTAVTLAARCRGVPS